MLDYMYMYVACSRLASGVKSFNHYMTCQELLVEPSVAACM